MTSARKAMLIVAALIVMPFTAQIPGCVMAHVPKEGRVVDAETGKGIPNVIVIAAAKFYQNGVGWGPSNHTFLYSVVTTTDANGLYFIPSTWLDMKIGMPGASPEVNWAISALAPGYAVVGDDSRWEFDERGMTRHFANSTVLIPKTSGIRGTILEVDPIPLFKPNLTLKEEAVYYGAIGGLARASSHSTEKGDVMILKTLYEYFAPKVCALPPETELDRTTTDILGNFAADREAAYALFKQLEPKRYDRDSYDTSKYTARTVCLLITNGRGAP